MKPGFLKQLLQREICEFKNTTLFIMKKGYTFKMKYFKPLAARCQNPFLVVWSIFLLIYEK